jgi:ABC-type branched-subunit amino acid transport system substrate-binding protein
MLDLERGGSTTVSPDALERVTPPAGAPEGTVFATYGFPDPGSRTDEFYERFKAVYGRRPEAIVAARASDGLSVLANAIELAASVQPGFVSAAVREGFDVRGVLGNIEFEGGTNRPRVDATIVRIIDGRLRSVD